MILIIDNYDSFVYTLARYVQKLGGEAIVKRNDEISIDEIIALAPQAIILSPGPCAPDQAGICIELVRQLGSSTPILGVCLGHQAIGEAYGGSTIRAQKPVHGKSGIINHDGSGLFNNLPPEFEAGRYHSLVTDLTNCDQLKVTATSKGADEIMAIQHVEHPVFGVQFHPESILTENGLEIISNFLNFANYKGDKTPNNI